MTLAENAPAIILVEPQMGENIGAAARAMLNFGLTDLRLVAPRDGWPNERAVAMSASADIVIENTKVFENIEDAIADLQHLYAATARPRDMIKRVVTPKGSVKEMRSFSGAGEACGILFGKESWGLSSDHVTLADTIITVPLNPDFSSINLAQAVMLVAYEWFQEADETPTSVMRNEERPATKEELGHLFARIENGLEETGYFENIMARKPVILRNMRNMFGRFGLMESDIRAFQGIFKGMSMAKKKDRK